MSKTDISTFNPITQSDHLGFDWLGWNQNHKVYHPGVDINGKGSGDADLGNPIKAALDGSVVFVSKPPTRYNRQNGGFGWHVVIYHQERNQYTHYAHCNSILTQKGNKVKKGEQIAVLGKTGTPSAHLHFEVWTPEMFEIQRKYWRQFSYYPANKKRSWVTRMYVDPYEFMSVSPDPSKWAAKAWAWAKEAGYMDGTRPQDQITREETAVILHRYHLDQQRPININKIIDGWKAQEAVTWGIQNKIIENRKNLTLEQLKTLIMQYRFHNKFIKK